MDGSNVSDLVVEVEVEVEVEILVVVADDERTNPGVS
jgi:hypothetical protein